MSATASCRTCRHFSDSAPAIEAALPGLASLSSAYAAVRSDDGVCGVHHRLIGAAWSCGDHAPGAFRMRIAAGRRSVLKLPSLATKLSETR